MLFSDSLPSSSLSLSLALFFSFCFSLCAPIFVSFSLSLTFIRLSSFDECAPPRASAFLFSRNRVHRQRAAASCADVSRFGCETKRDTPPARALRIKWRNLMERRPGAIRRRCVETNAVRRFLSLSLLSFAIAVEIMKKIRPEPDYSCRMNCGEFRCNEGNTHTEECRVAGRALIKTLCGHRRTRLLSIDRNLREISPTTCDLQLTSKSLF